MTLIKKYLLMDVHVMSENKRKGNLIVYGLNEQLRFNNAMETVDIFHLWNIHKKV